jgi:Rieske Fe-S protein
MTTHADEPSSANGPETAGGAADTDTELNDAERVSLTGTTRADVYEPTRDPEDVSRAPDERDELDPPQWRQDFPIDWPKDEFVARRDFAKFLVLTSSAFTAGQAWIAARHLLRERREAAPRTKIASKGDVPVGGFAVFSYPSEHERCVLVRLGESEFVAFSQACTHLSCAVIPKVSEGLFVCPCHEGYFELRTGKNIAGPPPRPLPRILLEMQGEELFAVGVEERTVA